MVFQFYSKVNICISPGIPTASPFCKGGLRGIFLIQPGLFENLPRKFQTHWNCILFWIPGPDLVIRDINNGSFNARYRVASFEPNKSRLLIPSRSRDGEGRSKSAIQNPKSCLNRAFVQALSSGNIEKIFHIVKYLWTSEMGLQNYLKLCRSNFLWWV